jgi:cysteine desulfurase
MSIYLDYSATTPVDPDVKRAMEPYFSDLFGNASSVHAHGRKAKAALERSRETIAEELNVYPGEILFTSGGTESNNTALIGSARVLRDAGKYYIITSRAEHQAVLEPCAFLGHSGATVSYLQVTAYGEVKPETVADAITPETGLVSLMHANNELGTLNDIRTIGGICRERGVLFHTDAVQSFAKLPLDLRDLPVDLLSMSAHKIYGPKGIGALFIRKGVDIERFQYGGGQERGRRGGTENVPLAVGFARAVEIMRTNRETESVRLNELRARLVSGLRRNIPFVHLNTDLNNSLPHIVNIAFDARSVRVDGEALLMGLDTAGLSVSNGSACTSGSLEPSHVQLAIGHDTPTATSAIRFSMGTGTTGSDIDAAVKIVTDVVARIGRPVKSV